MRITITIYGVVWLQIAAVTKAAQELPDTGQLLEDTDLRIKTVWMELLDTGQP
jgi:hypothetical protein